MFLEDGIEVTIITSFHGGHVVRSLFEEGGSSDPFCVDRVFASPPAVRQHASITKLEERITELAAQKKALHAEVAALEKERDAKLAKFRPLRQTRVLEMYLDNAITHLVTEDYGQFRIMTRKDFQCSDDKRALKLLTLYGTTEGNLEWRLNHYRDGSGHNTTVAPCASEAEAVETLKGMIAAHFCERPSEEILTAAEKFGVPVPEEYKAALVAGRLAAREDELRKLRARIEVLEGDPTARAALVPCAVPVACAG